MLHRHDLARARELLMKDFDRSRGQREAAMTSKTIALRVLDGVFIGFTLLLMLAVAGLPMDWLLDLVEMSLREFQGFALFVVVAALLLIHAIATSDSAP
jgi:hypothetical protein